MQTAMANDATVQSYAIGQSADGAPVYAHQKHGYYRHFCVTGKFRTSYLCTLLASMPKRYPKGECTVVVLSSNAVYGRLLRTDDVSTNVLYLSSSESLIGVFEALSPSLTASARKKVFIALDFAQKQGVQDWSVYAEIFKRCVGKDWELLTAVDLENSVFSGEPGIFVGANNALLTVDEREEGVLTRVKKDGTLGLPERVFFAGEAVGV